MPRKPKTIKAPQFAAQLAREALLERLGTQWVVGQWLPPVAELAHILKTGHVSTHRAVVQLAQEGYLLPLRGKGTRVLKTAKGKPVDQIEQPNRPGQSSVKMSASGSTAEAECLLPGEAAMSRSPRIAIVRARLTDPLIHRMVDACMEAAKPMGAQFFFELFDGNEAIVKLNQSYDAVVIFNSSPLDNLAGVLPHSRNIVRVTTGQIRPELMSLSDIVTVDQAQVGALAANSLKEAGCESICFFGRGSGTPGEYDGTSIARLRGFEAAWGAPLDPEYMMFGQFYGPKTGRQGYLRWTKLSPRPQGIFAASDELAVGVLSAAILEGMVPGVDFQLVGVDGQERYRNSTGFPLTSIQMRSDAMGRQAARMLRQRLMEGETQPMCVTIPCSLYEGQTVRSVGPLSEVTADLTESSADPKRK